MSAAILAAQLALMQCIQHGFSLFVHPRMTGKQSCDCWASRLKPDVIISSSDSVDSSPLSPHLPAVRFSCNPDLNVTGLRQTVKERGSILILICCDVEASKGVFQQVAHGGVSGRQMKWVWYPGDNLHEIDAAELHQARATSYLTDEWQLALLLPGDDTGLTNVLQLTSIQPCSNAAGRSGSSALEFRHVRIIPTCGSHSSARRKGGTSWKSMLLNALEPKCSNLHGRQLTVAAVNFPPSIEFNMNQEGKYALARGFEASLLTTLAKSMNFSIAVFAVPNLSWGQEFPNGSFDGIIGSVASGEADLAANDVAILESRVRVVDFSEPYIRGLLSFVTRRPPPIGKVGILLRPFQSQAWAWIGGTFLATTAAIFVTHRSLVPFGRPTMSSRRGTADGVQRAFLESLKLFIGEGSSKFISNSPFLKAVGLFLVAVHVTVLTATFSGSLTAYMVRPGFGKVPTTYEELRQATHYKISLRNGSVFEDYLTGKLLTLQQKQQPMFSRDRIVPVDQSLNGFKLVQDNANHAHITPRMQILNYIWLYNLTNTLQLSEDGVLPYYNGAVLKKGSPLKPVIDELIRRILAAGLFQHWVKQSARDFGHKNRDLLSNKATASKMDLYSSDNVRRPLSLTDVQSIFFVLAVSIVLGIIVLGFEICYNLGSRKRHSQ